MEDPWAVLQESPSNFLISSVNTILQSDIQLSGTPKEIHVWKVNAFQKDPKSGLVAWRQKLFLSLFGISLKQYCVL